jgi:hypothetical protein
MHDLFSLLGIVTILENWLCMPKFDCHYRIDLSLDIPHSVANKFSETMTGACLCFIQSHRGSSDAGLEDFCLRKSLGSPRFFAPLTFKGGDANP